MNNKEIKEVEALYERCKSGEFTCTKCKDTIKQCDCKGCTIYFTHFDND